MSNGTDVMNALNILAKYTENIDMCPEHDEIYIGHEIPPGKLSLEERKKMVKYGFDWDEYILAWHGYVSA